MGTVLITGGIGSGKSAVCRLMVEAGVPVYDSDSRTKTLYDSDLDLVRLLESEFGTGLMTPEGTLDRRAFAEVIFRDPDALSRAEFIIHPRVKSDFLQWADRRGDVPFVIMESAIAASKPAFEGFFDCIVLVDAPIELRIRRACGRDKVTEAEVLRRIASQDFSEVHADVTIWNDSDMDDLRNRVNETLKLLYLQFGK